MKKSFIGSSFIFFLMSIMFMGFVSAQSFSQELGNLIDDAAMAVEPISVYLLGNASTGEILFAKTLLLLIIVSICWAVFSEIQFFKEKKSALYIVSIVMGILSIRFFPEDIVRTIFLPYTTLGIVVSAGLPFILFFFLVNIGLRSSPRAIRRTLWLVFAVTFVGFWIMKSNEMGKFGYIYLITAILALIMMKMDGTFARYFAKVKIEKEMSVSKYRTYARLLEEIEEVHAALSDAKISGDSERAKRLGSRIGLLRQEIIKNDGR